MRSASLATLAAPAVADVDSGWIPGHYRIVSRTVWVPGCRERVLKPARYGWCRGPGGVLVRHLVRPPGHVTVFAPGHYETVRTRVWVPGHYAR